MLRSKIKNIALIVTSLIFASLLILFGLFVYYLPDTPISFAVFKTSYSLFPFKKSFLEFYSPADRNFGFNTRTDVDDNKFLLQRIETTNDESEIAAIAHYYVLQAKTRNYDIFINVSDKVKPLIINQLIKELDNENSGLGDKIMLLETTRTNKRIGKGSIWITGDNQSNYPQSLTMDERLSLLNQNLTVTGVKQKYQEWWNSNLSWKEKKKINPLEGTGIKVSSCCG